MLPEEQQKNYELFRDCLSTTLISKAVQPESKPRRRSKKAAKSQPSANSSTVKDILEEDSSHSQSPHENAASEELADFVDYIAGETFAYLPEELKTLDYFTYAKDSDLQTRYALPLTGDNVTEMMPSLDPSVAESLLTYGITDESKQGIEEFLAPVLTAFMASISTPPPAPASTKQNVKECEICGRDWVRLTYHHLIPRFVHAKVVKRGWHRKEDLQNVAWLCGACHQFVHRFANHEELARYYYTVDLLLEQEVIVNFAKWVGRVRWKSR
jgi:hypothetical protein